MADVYELVKEIEEDLKETVKDVSFNEEIETVPTGIDLFDTILGGGIPVGKLILITGSPGGGKTSLAASAIASLHRNYPNSLALYLDAEQSMSKNRLAELGVDTDRAILISQDLTVEKVSQIIVRATAYRENKKYKGITDPFFVVWDSESATMTTKQLEATDDPSKVVGQKSNMLSLTIPKLVNIANKYKMTFIVISQLRDKISMNPYAGSSPDLKGLGDKRITGGNVMRFHPFQIVYMKPKEDIDIDAYGFSGVVSEIKLVKNKLFRPNIKINIVLDYIHGYNDFWTRENLIRQSKCIKGTAWQYLDNCPDIKFRKSEILNLYNTNELFRAKFDELYIKCKDDLLKSSVLDTSVIEESIEDDITDEPFTEQEVSSI
ncbi:MAG TPA: ATPase domain-containing protein [Candidatus Diapherotrites archaeon]|nr:ATPase domain-containing protein [Candidatus Diapherotrites archaeon]